MSPMKMMIKHRNNALSSMSEMSPSSKKMAAGPLKTDYTYSRFHQDTVVVRELLQEYEEISTTKFKGTNIKRSNKPRK